MQRIFVSHSSLDSRQALGLKQWLVEQDPPLANEIFLDIDPQVGLRPGERWKDRLQQASKTCEAVVCLLSPNWEASHECKVEYRVAENLNKQILCARLEPSAGDDLTAEWQRCDLFGDGPTTTVQVPDGPPVVFATDGLYRLRDAVRGTGISAYSFVWPPRDDPDRAPYRGWEPLDQSDAAVFFGRDAAIMRALDKLRGMRMASSETLFVILGPSGTGKSSFLRAGLLPRLAREDRRFVSLGIVRPGRRALTGDTGLAAAIWAARNRLNRTTPSLGEIKNTCAGETAGVRELLVDIQQTAAARLPVNGDQVEVPEPPTLVLALDQAEELFSSDAGAEGPRLLQLIRDLADETGGTAVDVITIATIRTDRYEAMQTHPDLAGVRTRIFDDLKPMPTTQFKELITGPAVRATEAGRGLIVAPDLVERLLLDAGEGADTLPALSLTLARLFADYASTGEITLAHYEAMGGMRHVIETEIDEVLAASPEERAHQLECLRSAFIPWLATINPDGNQPMRRVARYEDLPEVSRPLVDALVGKRLLVKDHRDGQVVVEVALESLLRQWDDLAGWLREQRNELVAADDIERSAAAWHANGEDPAWLLHGTRLADAEHIVASESYSRRLDSAREYLHASRDAENQRLAAQEEQRQSEVRNLRAHAADLRKRSRVLRAVLAVTASAAVVAAVAGGYALRSQRHAEDLFRQATSVRLAAEAQSILAKTRAGGDVQAILQTLAAGALSPGSVDGPAYTEAVKTFSTLKLIQTPSQIAAGDISPDGRRIVTGGADPTLHVWDTETGQPLHLEFHGHTAYIDEVMFSPDGSRVASASDDRTVRLWDANTGQQIGEPLTGHSDEVWTLAYNPRAPILASGSKDTTIRLWSAETGAPIGQPLRGHTAPVHQVQFSPDGRLLLSAGDDNTLRLWDVATGSQIGQPFATQPDQIYGSTFSSDGRRILTGDRDSAVREWDVATATLVGRPIEMQDGAPFTVAYSGDGRLILSVDTSGFLHVWSAETGQPLGAPVPAHDGSVFRMMFNRAGTRMVSVGVDGAIRIWDVSRMPFAGHTAAVSAVALSPSGLQVASASEDRTVRLWDAHTGRPVGAPLESESALTTLAFSNDGRTVVAGGTDGSVRLWDTLAPNGIGVSFSAGPTSITSMSLSANGSRLVTAVGRVAQLWDVNARRPIGPPMVHSDIVKSVAFNPAGTRIASGAVDNSIAVWDSASSRSVAQTKMKFGDEVRALAFSPDGKILASAGTDGKIRLWDAATLQPSGEPLAAHNDTILSLAFSRDGAQIASASRDDEIRLWDIKTQNQIGDPLTGHSGDVTSIAFSPRRKISGIRQHRRHSSDVAYQSGHRRPLQQAERQPEPQAVEHLGFAAHPL